MQTSQVRITHEGEMYGCETCAPHEQDDATAVDSVVNAMYMLTVIADGVKAVSYELVPLPTHREIAYSAEHAKQAATPAKYIKNTTPSMGCASGTAW